MSNDRAIGMQIPQYDDKLLITQADLAYWEALYTDGTVLRETDGKSYAMIDRGRLASFRIVHHGEILAAIFPDPVKGSTGYDLIYRRRTQLTQSGGGRKVLILLGFAPMGPVLAIDVDNKSYGVKEGFIPNDPVFSAPAPYPFEPQTMYARKP